MPANRHGISAIAFAVLLSRLVGIVRLHSAASHHTARFHLSAALGTGRTTSLWSIILLGCSAFLAGRYRVPPQAPTHHTARFHLLAAVGTGQAYLPLVGILALAILLPWLTISVYSFYGIFALAKTMAVSATLDNRTEGCFRLFTDGDELKNRNSFPSRRNEHCNIPLPCSQGQALRVAAFPPARNLRTDFALAPHYKRFRCQFSLLKW